jgi:hypothetical protein
VSLRCAGCDIPNGCPEYCRCGPALATSDPEGHRQAIADADADRREREGVEMTGVLIVVGMVSALMVFGYLAGCAAAGRWLSLREWL